MGKHNTVADCFRFVRFSSICIGSAVNFQTLSIHQCCAVSTTSHHPLHHKIQTQCALWSNWEKQKTKSRFPPSLFPCSLCFGPCNSLGLFADLFHQLLDVIFHELNLFLLASQGLLQAHNALHQHSLVHLWEAVHHHD